MSKIGISYHGLCQDFEEHRFEKLDTPDGHMYGRPILIRELLHRGHEVVALQRRREKKKFCVSYVDDRTYMKCTFIDNLQDMTFPDLDVIFLEWRWPTVKNDKSHPQHDARKYEPDLDRQREIIEHYRGNVPIIAWDTDLKITPEDEERYPELILTDPSLKTNRQTRERTSLPFWSDWKELFPVAEPYPVYGYIGNNYERSSEFKKYYFSIQNEVRELGAQVSMYGNWLQRSVEREAPERLISTHKQVAFNHRMNFYDSMKMLNRIICTTHVSKPRYYETGFMSPRYLEALACNCPALVPASQIFNGALGRKYIVGSGSDVLRSFSALKDLTLDQRAEVVAEQKHVLQQTKKFDVMNAVEFIESQIK